MGLDVVVKKVVPLGNRKPKDVESFLVLKDHPELQMFNKLAFNRINEYYDIEKALADKGLDINELESDGCEFGETVIFFFHTKEGKEITIEDPPIKKRKELCLTYEQVGYQRKGANEQFYVDDMWSAEAVTDLKTLKEHWKKYFSDKTGYYGSAKSHKEHFKKNIIDKFIEGETFVLYC